MTIRSNHFCWALLATGLLSMAVSGTHAQTIQFNFTDEASGLDYTGTEAPAHAIGGLGSGFDQWNTVRPDDGNYPVSGLGSVGGIGGWVDAQGNNVGVQIDLREGDNADFDAGLPAGGNIEDRIVGAGGAFSGIYGTELMRGIWFGRPSTSGNAPEDGVLAVQVSGLAAGDYQVFSIAREPTGAEANRDYNVYFGADTDDTSAIADFASSVQPIAAGAPAAWTQNDPNGSNFASNNVTIGSGDSLVVFIEAFNAGTTTPTFVTMQGLQIVNVLDLAVAGDIDGDGDVDFTEAGMMGGPLNNDGMSDFDILRSNFYNTGVARTDGDLNNDDIVNFSDFRLWKNAFIEAGGTLSSNISLVPEPTSLALFAMTGLGCLAMRRTHR